MKISRISTKGQISIPKKIRETLGVKPGDLIAYETENGVVMLKRVDPFDIAFHTALSDTLDEWNSTEDDNAFKNL